MSAGSRASGSDDEPLVPVDFDDDFYANLMDKVPEVKLILWNKKCIHNLYINFLIIFAR